MQYNAAYISLYPFTVPHHLFVISGPFQTQTSVHPLRVAVKVIWAFPKTHTPTAEIQVRFPLSQHQLQ